MLTARVDDGEAPPRRGDEVEPRSGETGCSTGGLLSADDEDDLIYDHLSKAPPGFYMEKVPLPEYWDNGEYCSPPRDQGRRGTCAAFAAAALMEIKQKRFHTRNSTDSHDNLGLLLPPKNRLLSPTPSFDADTSKSANTSPGLTPQQSGSGLVATDSARCASSSHLLNSVATLRSTPSLTSIRVFQSDKREPDVSVDEAKPSRRKGGERPKSVALRRSKNDHRANYLSPEFVYYYRANQQGDGMFGREVCDILTKRGICREEFYPYQGENATIAPDKYVEQNARKLSGGTYVRLRNKDYLKQALYCYGACLMVLTYTGINDERFWDTRRQPVRDYHMVAGIGYDETNIICQNSWGCTWNGDGRFSLPLDRYEDTVMECWLIMNEPNPKKTPPRKRVKFRNPFSSRN